jgi:hypothetical protein
MSETASMAPLPRPDAEPQQEEKKEPTLRDILDALPGAPSEEQIEEWKQEHGEVFCSGLSTTEIYVFRPVSRQEFVAQQMQLAQAQDATQFHAEEMVVESCLLWGSDDGMKSLQTKAGSLSTLHEQIMQNSNFVNPSVASALVIKL